MLCTDGESNQNNGTEAVEPAELGIVYDLFLAQFRSTLTCPVCYKQSSKLDPLLLVPLPISEKYKMPVYATVVRWRTVPPQVLQVAALLSTCDMVSDLRSRIAALTHVAAEQASFCQLLSHNLPVGLLYLSALLTAVCLIIHESKSRIKLIQFH